MLAIDNHTTGAVVFVYSDNRHLIAINQRIAASIIGRSAQKSTFSIISWLTNSFTLTQNPDAQPLFYPLATKMRKIIVQIATDLR